MSQNSANAFLVRILDDSNIQAKLHQAQGNGSSITDLAAQEGYMFSEGVYLEVVQDYLERKWASSAVSELALEQFAGVSSNATLNEQDNCGGTNRCPSETISCSIKTDCCPG